MPQVVECVPYSSSVKLELIPPTISEANQRKLEHARHGDANLVVAVIYQRMKFHISLGRLNR